MGLFLDLNDKDESKTDKPPLKIRAEEVIVEVSLNGETRELLLTQILMLLMAEVLDNPSFRTNLENILSHNEKVTQECL